MSRYRRWNELLELLSAAGELQVEDAAKALNVSPATVRRDFDELHGRGLAIVDSESSRWGIHEGTTHVWFELELSGPRLGTESKPPPPGFDEKQRGPQKRCHRQRAK